MTGWRFEFTQFELDRGRGGQFGQYILKLVVRAHNEDETETLRYTPSLRLSGLAPQPLHLSPPTEAEYEMLRDMGMATVKAGKRILTDLNAERRLMNGEMGPRVGLPLSGHWAVSVPQRRGPLPLRVHLRSDNLTAPVSDQLTVVGAASTLF